MRVVQTPVRTPNMNAVCERFIGSARRECLDHVIVLNDRHLRRILGMYFEYYHSSRTHLSLQRNAPTARAVEPQQRGKVISFPKVGGLHHRYAWRSAS